MKAVTLLLLFFISNYSFGQEWTAIGNTGIQISILKSGDNVGTYFMKGVKIIYMPNSLGEDFKNLFADDKRAFDFIVDSCMGIRPFVFSDSLQSFFRKSGIERVVWFTTRTVQKKSGSQESWNMTNMYGQGQPCWTSLRIKKTAMNKTSRMRFVRIYRGMCEI